MIYLNELSKEAKKAVKMGRVRIGETEINTIQLFDEKYDFINDVLQLRGDVESFVRRGCSFGKDTFVCQLVERVYSRFLESIADKNKVEEERV